MTPSSPPPLLPQHDDQWADCSDRASVMSLTAKKPPPPHTHTLRAPTPPNGSTPSNFHRKPRPQRRRYLAQPRLHHPLANTKTCCIHHHNPLPRYTDWLCADRFSFSSLLPTLIVSTHCYCQYFAILANENRGHGKYLNISTNC